MSAWNRDPNEAPVSVFEYGCGVVLLLLILFGFCACDGRGLRTPTPDATWRVWFHPDVEADHEAVLVLLTDVYADYAIEFAEEHEEPLVAARGAVPNTICVYPDDRGVPGRLGAAFLDPGNRTQETNCGMYRGVWLGVFDWAPLTEQQMANVLAHEIGHSLGLEHYEWPHLDPTNLMNATLPLTDFGARTWNVEQRAYLEEILGLRAGT